MRVLAITSKSPYAVSALADLARTGPPTTVPVNFVAGNIFDSGLIDAGKQWSYTFTRAGSFAFHCTPHPFMKGVVVVR